MPRPSTARGNRTIAVARSAAVFGAWVLLSPALLAAEAPDVAPADAADAVPEPPLDDVEPGGSEEISEKNTVKTVLPTRRSVEDSRFASGFVTRAEVAGAVARGEDLGDVLGRVSGVHVRRSAGFGREAFVSVRGGNARQLAVSLNGVRVSAPVGVGFDVGSLSLAGVDAADVYRGPAGTIYGSGALSGALDLRTDLARARGRRARVEVLGGAFGTRALKGDVSVSAPERAFRFAATWRQSDGDFDFIDEQDVAHRRVNNDHWQLGLSGAGRLEVGRHEFTPLVMFEDGGGGAPGPSEFQAQYRDARLGQRRFIAQAGWARRDILQGDWGATDARARLGWQRRRSDYHNLHAFPGDSRVDDESTFDGLDFHLESATWLTLGDLFHARIEGRHETYEAAHSARFSASEQASRVDADRTTFAGALSNELLLMDEAISLIAGLRAEYIADGAARPRAAEASPGAQRPAGPATSTERIWTPLIPSLGTIWRAAPWLQFKANLARTFRAPDFDELYLDMVGVRGQPGLEAERAVTWDVGARVGSEDSVAMLELAWFQSHIEQSIHFVARTAYLFEAANLGAGLSRGVEAAAGFRPVEPLTLRAGYTWTDAWLDAMPPGAQLPGQPAHQANAEATVEFRGAHAPDSFLMFSAARLFAHAHWRSRTYLDSFGNLYNPPFWTVDLGAAILPRDWVEFSLHVRNIADHQRGADSLHRPLPGRAIYLAMTLDFNDLY